MDDRAKFRNGSDGRVGVVKIDARGDRTAIDVAPGEEVWLTQQEIIETAEAPRQAKDSPFEPRKVAVVDEESGQQVRDANDEPVFEDAPAPLEQLTEGRPVPTTRTVPTIPQLQSQESATAPPEGKNAPGEEIGTPEAQEIAMKGEAAAGSEESAEAEPEKAVTAKT